jgi:PAS domain S-box-containing protein
MADSRLASLARASARITAAPTLAQAVGIAAEEARAIIGAHQSAIHLSDDGAPAKAIHHVSLSDKYADWRGGDGAANHAGLRRLMLNGNGPLRLTQAQLEKHPNWPGTGGAVDGGPPLRGCLAAPLGDSGREPAGLIYLSDKSKGNFTADDALVLAQLADLASLAIRNFHLREAVGSAPAGDAQPPAGIEEEASFRYLFDKNPTPMWVYDLGSLAFLEVNQAALQHYGYSRAEFLAMRITDIRPTEDLPRLMDLIADRAPGLRYVGTWRHRLKAGTTIDVDISSATIEFRGRPAVLVVARDITQQVQTEAALRATEARFQSIVQNAPFVTYIKDTEGRYLFYNRESERVFHITGTEMIGKTIRDVYPEAADSALIDDLDRQVVETGEPVVTEVRMPATTELEWAVVIKFPIRDKDGRIVGIGGFDLDVAKQKHAEFALKQSEAQRQATEQRFGRIVDLVQEGIWIHVDGTILFANPAAARLFGARTPEALIGRSIFSLLHPEDRERALERTHSVALTLQPVPLREMRVLGLDGQTRLAELQAVPFEEHGRLHVVSSGRDVTAQREAETRLHQAQKMDAVGQLTGGVAHDFNNLLTVIIGNLDLDRGRLPAEFRPAIEQALRAAERGAALTHRLLAFSRRQTLIAEKLDLNRLAADMEDLLRRTLGEHVEIEMKLPGGLWPALADKGQVENALLNLAINARDAIAVGGKLTIETGNMHLDADYAAHNADVTAGDYVMLAVTDTGAGMPPQVVEHAFEPFFTTKDIGKGTGLGLSMIYGFAKQSRGHVKIYSEVGHGTTVRLYLPRLSAGVTSAETVAATPSPHPRGGETILVVEDDVQVRAFVLGQLRDLGYRVIEAADGPQAQEILESDAAIDLLFTDVVMPGGLTGRQLAEAAKQRRPALKTLFTSGYTEDSVQRLGQMDPGVRLLSKPYRRHDLAMRIREALDG